MIRSRINLLNKVSFNTACENSTGELSLVLFFVLTQTHNLRGERSA